MAEERLELRIDAVDNSAPVIERAEQNVRGLGQASIEELREIAAEGGVVFRSISQGVDLATADFRAGIISVGEYKEALALARQEALNMRLSGVTPLGQELTAFNRVMTATATTSARGTAGLGSLRSAMGSLAFTTAGLPGRLGEVSSIVSGFAIGSLTTAGIFAGLAALGAAYRHFGQDAREASEGLRELREEVFATQLQGDQALAGEFGEQIRQLREIRENRLGGGFNRFPNILRGTRAGAFLGDLFGREADFLSIAQIDEAIAGLEARLQLLAGGAADELLSADTLDRARRNAAAAARARAARAAAFDRRAAAGVTGIAGQAPGLPALQAAFPADFEQQFDVLITTPVAQINRNLTNVAEAMGETELFIRQNGRALVGAIGGAALSIAQFSQGNVAGGLGGLFSSLSFVPGIGDGLGFAFGLAGVGFSLIDALTDDRHRETQKQAHLDALKEFENERPPANIILRFPDSGDRDFQRLLDDTRREAQDAGFNPRLAP